MTRQQLVEKIWYRILFCVSSKDVRAEEVLRKSLKELAELAKID